MTVGCNTLMLILRNFARVIKTNIQAPIQTLGVDIPREERLDTFVFVSELLLSLTH
jgi:katanin p80 WD40 repeat-containing subunit B1